jgi:hypothetical protein
MLIYSPLITGSFELSGSTESSGPITAPSFTGSLQGTASIAISAENAISASYATQALTASYAVSASHEIVKEVSSSHADNADNAISASYALTASYAVSASHEIVKEVSSSHADNADNAISASYALTASYIDPTFISASAAAEGFGQGGVTSIIAGSGISIDQSTGDVTITSTGGGGTTTGTIVSSSFTNVTSTSFVHNFNTKNILVEVFDTNSNRIYPDSLTLTTEDKIDITFASPQSGYFVILKGQNTDFESGSYLNVTSTTLSHSLNTRDLNVEVYDENYSKIIPSSITITDESTIDVEFAFSASGYVYALAKENRISSSFSSALTTSIPNTLGVENVVVSVYDTNYSEFIPSAINVGTGSIDVDFAIASSGHIVIAGGEIDARDLATTYKTSISGNSTYTITHNLDEEFPLVQVYESSSRAQYIPESIVSINEDTIQITFASTFSGFVIVNS